MDETAVFRFSPAVLAIPYAVAVCSAIGMVFLWREGRRLQALAAGAVSLAAGLLFGPAMWHDQVVVSEARITQSTGIPWAQTVKGFAYDEVDYVRITKKRAGPNNRRTMILEGARIGRSGTGYRPRGSLGP